VPAYLSGEEAEHVVEEITSVNKTAIETHEDMAEIAFWVLMMNAAIALGTLIASKKTETLSKPLIWINMVMVLIVFILMARTGWSGGEIRHSEVHFKKQDSSERNGD
jgi:cytosine/uracil/thiamine/allantoin permease